MPNEIHNIEVAEKLLDKAIASMMKKLETFEFTGSPADLASNEKFEQAYVIMENYHLITQLINYIQHNIDTLGLHRSPREMDKIKEQFMEII